MGVPFHIAVLLRDGALSGGLGDITSASILAAILAKADFVGWMPDGSATLMLSVTRPVIDLLAHTGADAAELEPEPDEDGADYEGDADLY